MSYHRFYSPHLRHDFELKVWGHAGRPVMVFPSSEGRFFDFENRGMIDVMKWWIDSGRLQVFCVDAIDSQSLFNKESSFHERAKRQREYVEAIVYDVVPYIRNLQPESERWTPFLATGCSWGAYHSINFLIKYPEIFERAICLSGVYSLQFIFGDYSDDEVYFQDPLQYLPNINGHEDIEKLKRTKAVIVVGQGRWEEESIRDSDKLAHYLGTKGVDVWYDKWGHDVDHDWPAWLHQLPYFLHKCGY
eukprot:TRINITY_DN4450_c0_g1_i1.p1 TRINITY_DN4450_c0_g1~~TRINITY_DN4450_c0_g1_i1.p1  ORF type:complete len:259 (-),score=42.01 TRINITY_DN4450_c0_g1_i1:60-800(-)